MTKIRDVMQSIENSKQIARDELLKKYKFTDSSRFIYDGIKFEKPLKKLEIKFWRYWSKRDVPKKHQQFLDKILSKIQ